MYYYDEETIKQLRSYKLQIAACFLSIIALIITISLLNELYSRTYYNDNIDSQSVYNKSKTAALLYVIVSFYFTYVTFQTYKKNQNKRNYTFFIVSALISILTLIRYLNITNNDVSSGGDVI